MLCFVLATFLKIKHPLQKLTQTVFILINITVSVLCHYQLLSYFASQMLFLSVCIKISEAILLTNLNGYS